MSRRVAGKLYVAFAKPPSWKGLKMALSPKHRHAWSMGACTTCGLTRGRASRIDGDLATILRFLAKDGSAALSKMDPVNFAVTISTLRDAARDHHEQVIAKAIEDTVVAKAGLKTFKVPRAKTKTLTSKTYTKVLGTFTIPVDADISVLNEETAPGAIGVTVTTEEV